MLSVGVSAFQAFELRARPETGAFDPGRGCASPSGLEPCARNGFKPEGLAYPLPVVITTEPIGEAIHVEIQQCKESREGLLHSAAKLGYKVHSLRDLSVQLDSQWPAIWTHRLGKLENQLSRIQQLSMGLWISAFQSKSYVSELLLILSTGKAESATYAPNESHSLEGGFLINEAA
jgi:hypothetical protein